MKKYHIALSFAGEDRKYVEEVANYLQAAGVDVFYDLFEEEDLWGKDLYEHLTSIYRDQAMFTVMFVSEFYVKKGAKLTFTMIHNWAEKMAVRPRSATIVEQGGLFLSNYVCMQPVGTLQMYPVTHLVGEDSTARYNSILVATPGSEMDVGSRVFLKAKGARAEIISRAITTGGKITARGHIKGEVPGIKAHLECKGLILSDKGIIHAVPELEGHRMEVDLSHEAAVGKIAQEEVEYLMARGLSEEEATSTIVRGFLHVEIEGLPPELKAEMDRAVEISEKSLL